MMSRYKEVAHFVFLYRDHGNPLVRRSITALLPRMAHFLRDPFVSSHLQVTFYVERFSYKQTSQPLLVYELV